MTSNRDVKCSVKYCDHTYFYRQCSSVSITAFGLKGKCIPETKAISSVATPLKCLHFKALLWPSPQHFAQLVHHVNLIYKVRPCSPYCAYKHKTKSRYVSSGAKANYSETVDCMFVVVYFIIPFIFLNKALALLIKSGDYSVNFISKINLHRALIFC